MIDLLPCPFCASQAKVYCSTYNGIQFYVSCSKCYCSVGENYDRDACPDHHFTSEEDAVTAWNRRDLSTLQRLKPYLTIIAEPEADALYEDLTGFDLYPDEE